MELLADPSINRFSRDGAQCALRPEHITLYDEKSTRAGLVSFDMLVTAYETNGDESFVHGQVEAENWVMRCRGMLPVRAGQQVVIAAAAQDVVNF